MLIDSRAIGHLPTHDCRPYAGRDYDFSTFYGIVQHSLTMASRSPCSRGHFWDGTSHVTALNWVIRLQVFSRLSIQHEFAPGFSASGCARDGGIARRRRLRDRGVYSRATRYSVRTRPYHACPVRGRQAAT